MIKVAIVEDDRAIRTLMKIYLEDENFHVMEYTNGQEALEELATKPVDCIISDIMMPGLNGYAFCEHIRKFSNVPLLMVTAKGTREDVIQGFQVGTDDYLVKPFDPMEFVLRVKALLKRSNIQVTQEITSGNVTIKRDTMQMFVNDRFIQLKLKEYELLRLLVANIGHILTRELLIEKIWGYAYDKSDRTLDVHIARLRDHLETLAAQAEIKTVRGVGYGIEVKRCEV